MYNGKKILALIPARSGSEGLPGKNIKPLAGKPLIAWTIEQARGSRYIDRIITSTDSKKIAEIAKKYGSETPFLRPPSLATADSKGMDVILHALEWLRINDKPSDMIIYLQPTSPLRASEDIDNAIRLLFLKKAQAVISVCQMGHHPYWANILPKNGCMKNFIKKTVLNRNRQELPAFYRLNGAIDLGRCDYIKRQKNFLGSKSYAYIMPPERSVDIDNEFDFKIAEFLLINKFSESLKTNG